MASDLAGRVIRQLASFCASLILTFIGLTAVTFFIGRLTKIDPVLAVVGDKASKEVYEQAYQALGLDKPLIVQYVLYLKRVLSGDFGMSVLTSQPVLSDLLRVFLGDNVQEGFETLRVELFAELDGVIHRQDVEIVGNHHVRQLVDDGAGVLGGKLDQDIGGDIRVQVAQDGHFFFSVEALECLGEVLRAYSFQSLTHGGGIGDRGKRAQSLH